MSVKGKSLHILTPMYGGVSTSNYLESFTKLVLTLQRMRIDFQYTFVFNESLVSRARNRLSDEYLKTGTATHSVFIDADIGFEVVDILAMLELDKDIVGAGCVKKSLRWDRVQRAVQKNGRQYTPDELALVSGDFVINFQPFEGKRALDLREPQEVASLGTGLLMIRRNVFETFREKYPDRWYDSSKSDPMALPGAIHDFFKVGINYETREYDSEDYWFCQDSRALGFKVWLCPWMKTSHMGAYKFVGDLPAVASLTGEL